MIRNGDVMTAAISAVRLSLAPTPHSAATGSALRAAQPSVNLSERAAVSVGPILDPWAVRIRSRVGQLVPNPARIAVLVAGLAVVMVDPGLRDVAMAAVADAYLAVSVFVAATLFLFYGLERRAGIDAGAVLARHEAWQVPIAALLGAMPGCGGAIVVMTQFVAGRANFGAVVAVLTATMGDAAFVLIAAEPGTGALVMAIGLGVGMVSGWIVNASHGTDFLRQSGPQRDRAVVPPPALPGGATLTPIWTVLFVPGLILGLLDAAQVDTDALIAAVGWSGNGITQSFGVAGALLSLYMWSRGGGEMAAHTNTDAEARRSLSGRVAADTNFVTAWVVLAFLAFEVTIYATGFDLGEAFRTYGALVPLIGVVVGFLPGCGPQIVVTTLYVNGLIPFSAQVGNAISNDGDALFPAMALAPRAAMMATVYSAIPALIVAYGWYGLFE